jgi:hypothetical protein
VSVVVDIALARPLLILVRLHLLVSAWRTDPEGLRREEMPAALCPAARSDGYMFVVGKAMSLEIHCRHGLCVYTAVQRNKTKHKKSQQQDSIREKICCSTSDKLPLSYCFTIREKVVGDTGFEPVTSTMSTLRSNQLS